MLLPALARAARPPAIAANALHRPLAFHPAAARAFLRPFPGLTSRALSALARTPATPKRSLSSTPAFFSPNSGSTTSPGTTSTTSDSSSSSFFPAPPPPPPPPRKSLLGRARFAARVVVYLGFSSVLGLLVVTGGLFVYDALTYADVHVDRVPVNPLALNPERGGPKNLPIARANLRDEEDEEARQLATKPKLVIVGGGWGVSAALTSCCST
jgi:hypothetical protein